jgi:hypothetical protein
VDIIRQFSATEPNIRSFLDREHDSGFGVDAATKNARGESCMRRLVLALTGVAALATALPIASQPAQAREVVVIKRHHGPHYGWWHRHHYDRDWAWRHRHRDYRYHYGAAVIVR